MTVFNLRIALILLGLGLLLLLWHCTLTLLFASNIVSLWWPSYHIERVTTKWGSPSSRVCRPTGRRSAISAAMFALMGVAADWSCSNWGLGWLPQNCLEIVVSQISLAFPIFNIFVLLEFLFNLLKLTKSYITLRWLPWSQKGDTFTLLYRSFWSFLRLFLVWVKFFLGPF